MTLRQKFLKITYPVLMKAGEWLGMKAKVETLKKDIKPITSFYDLKAIANNGDQISFADFKGKNVLIVNTASDCGFTSQYYELEKLNELYKEHLIIIGFPSNDFKEQEKGTDSEIAAFCKTAFGIQFLLMKKSSVVKGVKQNDVYQWLTCKNKNGWNDVEPEWNFSKYLVNRHGFLTNYFGPAISPLSNVVRKNLD
ncbi:glutathione peroxidase [Segetibacter koreensis]|uniref:glutathione peroxidase n=1 Tax=Segetibacter koreensis TaxID=398037 RepID=UPI00036F8F4F|nr:glutathione peroxidase [Segetibacter koreensis]